MAEKFKAPALHREAQSVDIEIRKEETSGQTRLSLSASSTYPVERWFGTEILSHEPGAIRLDRATRGAMPLLFNHDPADPIGMVDGARVENQRLMVDAVLFNTPRAAEIAAMVEGGLRNVSIGYRLHEVTENVKSETYTATDWEPFEVSIVSIPADPSVGVGRSSGGKEFEVRVVRAEDPAALPAANVKPKTPEVNMDEVKNAAAGTNADQSNQTRALGAASPSGIELDQSRVRAIDNICKSQNIEPRIRDMWVTSGASVEVVSEELVRILEDRAKSKSTQSVASLGLSETETKRFSIARMILATASKDWGKAGFEFECSRAIAAKMNKIPDANTFFVPYEVQQREISRQAISAHAKSNLTGARDNGLVRADIVASGSTGGYLVETDNVSFIELLRNRAVAYRMGATPLGGLVGNVNVPRQTGAATAYWLGTESTQITEKEQAFGQVTLTAKTLGGYTEISRLLLMQSSPAVEGIVNADLAAILGLALDKGALSGDGTAGSPVGILNTSGVGTASGMTSIAFAGVLDFQYQVWNANVQPVRGGYASSGDVAKILMTRVKFTNTNTPLWDGNLWDGNVCGFPGMSSKQIANGTMIFGDWAQLLIAEWGVLSIEVNPFANFQAGIIGVRAMMTADVGLRYPGAFALGSSIT